MNLLAANEITPAVRRWKPYPAYKDSGVEWLGSVPSHWEMTNLKRIGTFQAGTGFPVEDQGRTEGQIPFYKVSDMNAEGNELWMSVHSNIVDLSIAERLGATVVAPKTIVFPKVGAALLTNKRRILKVPSCIDNNMIGFAPRKVDVMWMYYWLLGLDLGRLANPGAVPSINESQLREIPIALPIDIEQHAIVATLDRETAKVDALVAKKERLIDLLQEKRAALITHAVTKGLPSTGSGQATPNVPMKDSGIEWLGLIPTRWKVRKVKEVSKLQTGLTLGKRYEGERLTLRPYLRVANVQDGYLDLAEITEVEVPAADVWRHELQHGDVLMTEGGDFDKLGRGYVWEGQIPGCLHQNHIFAVRPTKGLLDSHFLTLVMNSHYGRAYFTATSKQSTNLASTNSTKLRNFSIPFLDLLEQEEIVNWVKLQVGRIDSLIAKIREGVEKLKEYRTALISAAVTGKIDVREDVVA